MNRRPLGRCKGPACVCCIPVRSDPELHMSAIVVPPKLGGASWSWSWQEMRSARERSDDSAWSKRVEAAPTAFRRQFPSLQQPTTAPPSPWKILPISRVSTIEISRPQPSLALHHCGDPAHTVGLECPYSCLSASWTANPSNQVTGPRTTPGPERCAVCYPAMPSRRTRINPGARRRRQAP